MNFPIECVFCNESYEDNIHVLGMRFLQRELRGQHSSVRTRNASMCTNDQPESSSARCQSWSKLAPGRYECNIDMTFSSSLNKVGIEMCVQDNEGSFVHATKVGEALGLYTALTWVVGL
jgi:hypothetical protein